MLLQSVLIKLRAGLALSTDALVADVVNKMFITFFISRNITSRLLSDVYFSALNKLFISFLFDAQYFIYELISS